MVSVSCNRVVTTRRICGALHGKAVCIMKMVKDKKLVVGADFAGYPLKEAVVAHLKAKG